MLTNSIYLLHPKPGLTTPQLILVGDAYSTYFLRTSLMDSSKKLPTTPVIEKIYICTDAYFTPRQKVIYRYPFSELCKRLIELTEGVSKGTIIF